MDLCSDIFSPRPSERLSSFVKVEAEGVVTDDVVPSMKQESSIVSEHVAGAVSERVQSQIREDSKNSPPIQTSACPAPEGLLLLVKAIEMLEVSLYIDGLGQ